MQTLAHFAGIGAFLLRFERGSRFERGRTQPSLQYVETRDLRSQIVTSSYWREDESKIGIGGDASRLRPSHTTGHAGPHPAVRRVELSEHSQAWNPERVEVSIRQRDAERGRVRQPPWAEGTTRRLSGQVCTHTPLA